MESVRCTGAAILIAFSLLVTDCRGGAAGENAPAAPQGPAARADGAVAAGSSSDAETDLAPGVVLKHWVSGGIAGFASELSVTADHHAELRMKGKVALRLPLTRGEAGRLADLIRRAQPVRTVHSDGPGVADGMSTGTLFAGEGSADATDEVRRFAVDLLQTAESVSVIAAHVAVVIGAVRDAPGRGGHVLQVSEVLKPGRAGAAVAAGSTLTFESFGARQFVAGERVWGITLSRERPMHIIGWRHAPVDLAPRIIAVLNSPAS
jgi:hypothetical protein